MNTVVDTALKLSPVREDFIPKEHYTSKEFAQLEKARLWQKVWQVACRQEEIPHVGNYVTYDILDESVFVVRTTTDTIKAYYNVCPHRGNELVSGRGSVTKLTCGFHGWQWNLEGKNIFIRDQKDWERCSGLACKDVGLTEVRVGQWGGFIFICLDPNAASFEEFIAPVPEHMDCLEFEKMSLIWYKTMPVKANWKTTMEAFMESYHIENVHPQVLPYLDTVSESYERGKHGNHAYPNARPPGAPSPNTGRPVPEDIRAGYVTILQSLSEQIHGSTVSYRSAKALDRVMDEIPSTASPLEVYEKSFQFMKEAAETEGGGFPRATMEQWGSVGIDWNIFPNLVLVFGIDCTVVFRARPNGDDPDSCIYDMWGLLRQAPGKEVEYKYEYFDKWQDNRDKIPALLLQDLGNMEKVQRGVKSQSFRGSNINPMKERQIFNHHRVLRSYLFPDDIT